MHKIDNFKSPFLHKTDNFRHSQRQGNQTSATPGKAQIRNVKRRRVTCIDGVCGGVCGIACAVVLMLAMASLFRIALMLRMSRTNIAIPSISRL